MYGADVFTYDAINELFPAAYEEAVKAAGIEPVGRPEVSVDSVSYTHLDVYKRQASIRIKTR